LPWTNTLAYFAAASATKKKKIYNIDTWSKWTQVVNEEKQKESVSRNLKN
jgi:hypothetical protein